MKTIHIKTLRRNSTSKSNHTSRIFIKLLTVYGTPFCAKWFRKSRCWLRSEFFCSDVSPRGNPVSRQFMSMSSAFSRAYSLHLWSTLKFASKHFCFRFKLANPCWQHVRRYFLKFKHRIINFFDVFSHTLACRAIMTLTDHFFERYWNPFWLQTFIDTFSYFFNIFVSAQMHFELA